MLLAFEKEEALVMGADLFMDGKAFDASRVQEYLDGFAMHSRATAAAPGEPLELAGECHPRQHKQRRQHFQ